MLPLLACGGKSKKDDDEIPLTITNAPACAPGRTYMTMVAVRIENGSDASQFRFGDPMFASRAWAGREVTVKVGLCEGDATCKSPRWLKTDTKKIGGDQKGLKLELPTGLELVCEGGTTAKN